MDESNGDYEIIDKNASVELEDHKNHIAMNIVGQSLLTNVAPPSELPSFVTMSPNDMLTGEQLESNVPVFTGISQSLTITSGPIATPPTISSETEPKIVPSWKSSKQVDTESYLTSFPVTSQPLSPLSSSCTAEMTANYTDDVSQNNNWMGWIKGTVQSVGNKVAEKAKSSMDTMITTLDPQMKELINSGGDVDIIVASAKEVKINPVREAFQKIFGKATVTGFGSQSTSVAIQPVGFEAALKAAEERINNVRNSGKIHPQQPVIAIEGFIVKFGFETWMELSILLLDDPYHDIILQMFTQPTPIPPEFMKEAEHGTPSDYPHKDTGYLIPIGKVAARRLNIDSTVWQETLTEVSRRDVILLAAKALAGLYKAQLPSNVI